MLMDKLAEEKFALKQITERRYAGADSQLDANPVIIVETASGSDSESAAGESGSHFCALLARRPYDGKCSVDENLWVVLIQ